jgi:hypothetical protein
MSAAVPAWHCAESESDSEPTDFQAPPAAARALTGVTELAATAAGADSARD